MQDTSDRLQTLIRDIQLKSISLLKLNGEGRYELRDNCTYVKSGRLNKINSKTNKPVQAVFVNHIGNYRKMIKEYKLLADTIILELNKIAARVADDNAYSEWMSRQLPDDTHTCTDGPEIMCEACNVEVFKSMTK